MVIKVMSANQAIAEAVKLANPNVIPVYPITPQTTISEDPQNSLLTETYLQNIYG